MKPQGVEGRHLWKLRPVLELQSSGPRLEVDNRGFITDMLPSESGTHQGFTLRFVSSSLKTGKVAKSKMPELKHLNRGCILQHLVKLPTKPFDACRS